MVSLLGLVRMVLNFPWLNMRYSVLLKVAQRMVDLPVGTVLRNLNAGEVIFIVIIIIIIILYGAV